MVLDIKTVVSKTVCMVSVRCPCCLYCSLLWIIVRTLFNGILIDVHKQSYVFGEYLSTHHRKLLNFLNFYLQLHLMHLLLGWPTTLMFGISVWCVHFQWINRCVCLLLDFPIRSSLITVVTNSPRASRPTSDPSHRRAVPRGAVPRASSPTGDMIKSTFSIGARSVQYPWRY